MAEFNYTDIHIFNKSGEEIPISIQSAIEIKIPSKYGEPAIFYPVIDSTGEVVSYYKKSAGSRFSSSNNVLNCLVNGEDSSVSVNFSTAYRSTVDSSTISECNIDDIDSINLDLSDVTYPSVKFNSSIDIKTVSTGLIETESLYVLGLSNGNYNKISSVNPDFADRYELLFYLDCKNQKDFRFFTLENDELVWSNKQIIDFTSSDDDSYRVNIGFCSEEEGTFVENIRIFLLDRGVNKTLSLEECDITEIGTIAVNAETIGEDERFRTLFANFGIPDPKTYDKIFANTENEEGNIDNILLNQNSKALFLSYSEIFPYAGTYKALVNAVNLLGYKDLYFKEWYKKIGTASNSNYVAYDMSYASNYRDNIINNTSIEERIHLKKLNWLSMMYKLNEELKDTPEDAFGFPAVELKYSFNNADLIAKLIALREWLQKYIVGLNCRIIEVSGEGVYFERYRNNTYSTYQSGFEWNNEHIVSPSVSTDTETVLDNKEATIIVSVDPQDYNNRLEDIADFRFCDFCEGYFDNSSIYHNYETSIDEAQLFVGKTWYSYNDLEEYKVKGSISCDSFLFNTEDFLDSSSCALRVYDNALYVNPLDIANHQSENCVFLNLPIIYIKSCVLRPVDNIDSSVFVSIENDDFVSVRGLSGASFTYEEEKKYGLPVFIIKNYDIHKLDSSLNNSDEYILDIIEGKLLFEVDTDTYKQITVNIDYTGGVYDKNIGVNVVSFSDFFRVKNYMGISKFVPGDNGEGFISAYSNNPDTAILYDFELQLPVNHVGEYKIDVYGFDEYNNIFAATCKKPVIITAPNYAASIYAATSSSNDAVLATADEKSLLEENYEAYCIYNKERAFLFDKELEDDSLSINYKSYTYSQPIPKKGNYVHLSNKFEKFKVLSISPDETDPTQDASSATSAEYIKDGAAWSVYKSYALEVEREYTNPVYDYIKNSDIDSDVKGDDYNPAYVNVVFYNELGGYPVYQTYAKMTPQEPNSSIYDLIINDDTNQSYIWACAEEPGITKSILSNMFINKEAEEEYSGASDVENYSGIADNYFKKCADKILGIYRLTYSSQTPTIDDNGATFNAYIDSEESKSFIVESYIDTDEEAKNNFVEFVKKPYPVADIDASNNWPPGWEDDNYAKAEDIYSRIRSSYIQRVGENCEQMLVYTLERSLLDIVFNVVSDFIIKREDTYIDASVNILKDRLKEEFISGGSVFSDSISTDIYRSISGLSATNATNQVINDTSTFINSKFESVATIEKDYSDSLFAIYSCLAYCVYINLKEVSNITNKPFIKEYFKSYVVGNTLLNSLNSHFMSVISDSYAAIAEPADAARAAIRTDSLNNFIKDIVSYDIKTLRTNWITRKDNNDVYYYAVAYPSDGLMYYLKPKDTLLNGYSYVSTELPENFTFDIAKLLSYPGISVYVEPLYRNVISIELRSDGRLEIIPAETGAYDMNMKVGDLLKIYIKNTINGSFIGQASYLIEEIENDSGINHYIVSGSINDQYIRGNGTNLLVKLPNDVSVVGDLGDPSITVGGVTYEIVDDSYTHRIYVNGVTDTTDSNMIAYSYRKQDDTGARRAWFVNIKGEGTYYFVVLNEIKNSNDETIAMDPVKYYTTKISDNIVMFMSYTHWAYVDYIVRANNVDLTDHENTIEIENNLDNRKLLTFADSKFLVSVRDFDVNEGIKQWMDFSDTDMGIVDPLKGTPEICAEPEIYRYVNDNPVLSRETPYVVIMPTGLDEDSYVYWRIYKTSTESSEPKYLFESYNKVLYLDSNEPGVYDVEMLVYDKYGNISRNMIKGAYTII